MVIKVVIGASYGDEGKGQMTDYFASKADGRCCVVLTNGGAQRGHTVEAPGGLRHVFKHIGSGTFAGADTYCPRQFIVNPAVFRSEQQKFNGFNINIAVDRRCMITTPWDMMANCLIEDARGNDRHGSCGMGIWETIQRNENPSLSFIWDDISIRRADLIFYKINKIKEYYTKRLNSLGEFVEIFNSDVLIDRFVEDCIYMSIHSMKLNPIHLTSYDTLIFENAQGLLLDQNNIEYAPHTTPSNTGIKNVLEICEDIPNIDSFEVCYVTRSYMTRHGAGRFDTECAKEDINPNMFDETNITNDYQGSLRYGWLDIDDLKRRIDKDFSLIPDKYHPKLSLAVTHLNEYEILASNFIGYDKLYLSNGKTRNDIIEKEN